MVESTGLLNRRRGQTLPQVRILSSPLRRFSVPSCIVLGIAKAAHFNGVARSFCDSLTFYSLTFSTRAAPHSVRFVSRILRHDSVAISPPPSKSPSVTCRQCFSATWGVLPSHVVTTWIGYSFTRSASLIACHQTI